MLHKNISYSKQVNSLSDFEKVLFTWTIPHLDDFGRIDGDAQTLKAIVMPMDARGESEFEKAICDMVTIGLVMRYETNDRKILFYPTFDKYQTGLGKRTESKYTELDSQKFSELPRNSQKFSEIPTQPNLTEPNLTKLNLTKPNLTMKSSGVNKTDNGESYKCLNPTNGFVPRVYEENKVQEIAKAVGEPCLDFYLKLTREGKFWAIEKAYGEFCENTDNHIKEPAKYFYSIVHRLVEEQAA